MKNTEIMAETAYAGMLYPIRTPEAGRLFEGLLADMDGLDTAIRGQIASNIILLVDIIGSNMRLWDVEPLP